MNRLPAWDKAIDVRVMRQGGVAALPALARPRIIILQDCPDDRRERLCAALADAADAATDACGQGDQRYFTIEIRYEGDCAPLRFDVPEAQAPAPLVRLWRDGEP